MPKELWLNLPVKDLSKSKEFFAKLGFSFNPRFSGSNEAAALMIGDKQIIVMLFPEAAFRSMTRSEVADTRQGAEVMISIDAESKEAVDELVRKAEEAGGSIFGKPHDLGWMYGAGFADLDGHRWNVLYMDNPPKE